MVELKLSELEVGKSFTYKYGPVIQEQITNYANASGDLNPIHTNEEIANKANKGIIAHGLLSFGIVVRFMSDLAGEGKIIKIDAQMRGKVRLGDDWIITATVKSINGNKVEFEIVEQSKTKIKIEKDGQIVKKFEAEERGWISQKDIKRGLLKTEQVPEGTLHYRLRTAIPSTAILELKK
ncbi:MAG: MaoC family dehydratase [Promethearchaeota archaeon]